MFPYEKVTSCILCFVVSICPWCGVFLIIDTALLYKMGEALAEHFHTSGTIVSAIGGYTRNEKQILYFIINHFQINKLKTIVREIDEDAFISLQDVSDIVRRRE